MWNPSLIDGPIIVLILGAADAATGERQVLGQEPGYHLNIDPALMAPDLAPFRVTPEQPARVWAGDEPEFQTVFLRFATEAEARSSALAPHWAVSPVV
jgi:hypothetical protein